MIRYFRLTCTQCYDVIVHKSWPRFKKRYKLSISTIMLNFVKTLNVPKVYGRDSYGSVGIKRTAPAANSIRGEPHKVSRPGYIIILCRNYLLVAQKSGPALTIRNTFIDRNIFIDSGIPPCADDLKYYFDRK